MNVDHFLVSETDAARRLNHRRNRSRNLHHEERVQIGLEAHYATAASVAEKWGISPSTVAQIKGGFIQTKEQRENGGPAANAKDETLVKEVKTEVVEQKKSIVAKAAERLLTAMNEITDVKLRGAKVRELSGVARDMSTVMSNMTEKKDGGDGPKFTFQIYAPGAMLDTKELGEPIVVAPENED